MRKLARPVVERGFGYDDEMRSRDVSMNFQIAEEGNCLECLSESLHIVKLLVSRSCRIIEGQAHHFIGKDSVDTVVVQTDHPVESLYLVVSHLSPLDDCASKSHQSLTMTTSELDEGRTCRRFCKDERLILSSSRSILIVCLCEQFRIFLLFRFSCSRGSSFPVLYSLLCAESFFRFFEKLSECWVSSFLKGGEGRSTNWTGGNARGSVRTLRSMKCLNRSVWPRRYENRLIESAVCCTNTRSANLSGPELEQASPSLH